MFDFERGNLGVTKGNPTLGEEFVTRENSATSSGRSAATCVPSDLNQPIELSRRAMAVAVEADSCSICLDCFSTDDPSAKTICGCDRSLWPHCVASSESRE